MRRRALGVVLLGLGLLAGGCGIYGVKSNDTGGIIPWSPENEAMAFAIASERCASFDKYARITSVHARYGDYIGFVCVWSPYVRPR
jgi:hypothetical protein